MHGASAPGRGALPCPTQRDAAVKPARGAIRICLSYGGQDDIVRRLCAVCAALDAAQWRLALQWLDRIDATGQVAERGVLLQGLRLTQPVTASAVQHLLELRHRMVAAEFLVTAWPPLVVASGKSGGDPSPGKR